MKKDRPVVPIGSLFKACGNPEYKREIRKAKDLCYKYNRLNPNNIGGQRKILNKLLGKVGENAVVTPPFWCDYGYNISLGDNFYSNHNLIITDGVSVEFGNNVFVAPDCCFTTAEHAIDPEQRRNGFEVAKPIRIGNDVWIGARSVILAGVSVGDGSVIGAGSVVTRDIPPGVVAIGVPCRVMREITEEDKSRYPVYRT